MGERLRSWWYAAREGLWFVPTILTLLGALLAIGLVELDRELALDQRGGRIWVFGGGAEGARGVLQAIAGSLVTVTGTVFSITIVALQLASGQFTPRVLRTFTRDRGVQVVLGVFIATFTYSILVLRVIRSENDDASRFVPGIAVVVAITLALTSVGFLIYFVHHVSWMIRVSAVLERVAEDGVALLERRFPSGIGDPAPDDPGDGSASVPAAQPSVVTADKAGYLRSISADALFRMTWDDELTIRIDPIVGDFVHRGEALASVWPAAACTDELTAAVRDGVSLGNERSLEEDAELPVRQLADIAVKALSPGINDPTTATQCVDRLGQLLVLAAQRGDPPAAYQREGSVVRLVVASPSYRRLVSTAFDQIRHYGAADPSVAAHLLVVLGRVAALVPPAGYAVLHDHAELVVAAARTRIDSAAELAPVEAAGAWRSRRSKEGGERVLR